MNKLWLFCVLAVSHVASVLTVDAADITTSVPAAAFKVEITSPDDGAVYKTFPALKGRANGVSAAGYVDVDIEREADGALWDGYSNAWRSGGNPLRSGVHNDKWSIGERLPQGEQLFEGRYSISATLFHGRTERARHKITITINNGRAAPDSAKNSGDKVQKSVHLLDAPVMPPTRPTLPPSPVSTPFPIVFTSRRDGNSEIYSMNSDGSQITRLTENPAEDEWPCISRDGTKIVFSSNRDGNYELYSMSIDGTSLTRLTNTYVNEIQASLDETGQYYVYIAEFGGDGTVNSGYIGTTSPISYSHSSDRRHPVIVRIGGVRYFVFSQAPPQNGIEQPRDLYRMKDDGTSLMAIANASGNEQAPAYNFNGDSLVYELNGDLCASKASCATYQRFIFRWRSLFFT
jgi:hypothetical protein